MTSYFLGDRLIGLSAQAIAGYGRDHPHDSSDLQRCIAFCERAGIDTAGLRERMAGRSPAWDRLLPEWDRLVELLRHEIVTRTDGTAPRTYFAMKCAIDNGTPCVDCGATGRGVECVKCKGTGRRGGGRCRADRCYRGADWCQTCSGRGYITPREAS